MSNHEIPRILVLTLYSGENEIGLCKESVSKQSGVKATHEIFENLPNIEAHRNLYARIMEQSKNYDWFIKLDADMVLNHENSLKNAIQHIEHIDKKAGMAIFTVQDWPTSMPIWGINVFSPSCKWDWVEHKETIPNQLFVDPDPTHKGLRLVIDKPPAPIASHMQNPSDHQAFFFGVHRALKAFSKDDNTPSPRAKTQWNILRAVGKHYKRTKDRQLALILVGAEYIRSLECKNGLPVSLNKNNEDITSAYEKYVKKSDEELRKIIKFWLCPVTPAFIWYFKRGGWRLILKRLF